MEEQCGEVLKPIPGMRFSITHVCGREKGHFGYHECEIEQCDKSWITKEREGN